MALGHTRRKPKVLRFKNIPKPGPQACHPRNGKHKKNSSQGCFPSAIRRRLTKRIRHRGGLCKKDHSKERCLLENSDIPDNEKAYLQKKYLRPPRPDVWEKDPDQWLDSNNITDVMKQYEDTYKDFKFLGVLPIDFAAPDPYKGGDGKCIVNTICDLKLPELEKSGISRLAAVVNLDPHFKDGSHWVGIFIDLRPSIRKVYYFDSYGIKPPQQIATLMRSLTLQDPDLTLEVNGRRFQYQGSECGMYSLYFIIRMLDGANFGEFCHQVIPDEEMIRLRRWIFS